MGITRNLDSNQAHRALQMTIRFAFTPNVMKRNYGVLKVTS